MNWEGRQLSREDILSERVIPHGSQFMFLESAEVVEPGKRAKGVLADRSQFSYLRDHFPGFPIFPGALQMEALAELVGIALISGLQGQEEKMGVLVGDQMRYRAQIDPKDRIELEAEIIRARVRSGLGYVESRVVARKDGKTVAEGKIKFALVDKPKKPQEE